MQMQRCSDKSEPWPFISYDTLMGGDFSVQLSVAMEMALSWFSYFI